MKVARKLLLAALMVGMGYAPAMAVDTSIGLEFRTDLQFNDSSKDDDEDPNEETKSTKFNIARARMNFKGKINDDTSYRARIRFDRSMAANSFDNASSGMDYWYIDRKLGNGLSLRLGKQFAMWGSIENDYSGMDVYQYSETNNEKSTSNAVGAGLSLDVGPHNFNLQVLNGQDKEANQDVFNINLAYYGNLELGAVELQPIVTYSMFPTTAQKDDGMETDAYTRTAWAAGTRVFAMNKMLQFDIEALNDTTPEYDTDDTEADTTEATLENSWDSMVYALYYNNPLVRPFVKFTSDQNQEDGEDITAHSSFSGGLEIFPDKEGVKTYRIHAVYKSATTSYENDQKDENGDDMDDLTVSQFNVGVSSRF